MIIFTIVMVAAVVVATLWVRNKVRALVRDKSALLKQLEAIRHPNKLMGFDSPADKKVPIRIGDWNAMKLALWRSKHGWEIVMREATGILARCVHVPGCPGREIESEPCHAQCPDREARMSALVTLNAARMFSPVDVRKVAEPYFAPSREYFSEVLSSLAVAQAELETLRAPIPPPNEKPVEIPDYSPPPSLLQEFDIEAESVEPEETTA
jgi:hypothetical protein